MNIQRALFLIFFSALATSCTNLPVMNKQLKELPATSYQQKSLYSQPLNSSGRSDDLSLFLTFSGGGTRAAALSYGVLESLKNINVSIAGKKRRLLDEVDLISSVSGGSFTSAYYGLFGDRLFQDFDRLFLKQKVQTELLKLWLLTPKNWVKLVPAVFGRSDLVAQHYSKKIFRNKKFGDIRKDSPRIVINATDLSVGKGFAFTPYYFSWICSDLSTFPIGRAVAASSAVPVLFSPILLENHMGKCNYSPVLWTGKDGEAHEKRYKSALEITKYRNVGDYSYLHLVDGGVADNLGIRSLLNMVTFHNNNIWHLLKTYKMNRTKKMVFVIVNAANSTSRSFARYRNEPTTTEVLSSVSNVQFNQFNDDTIDILRNKFPEWKKQIGQQRCHEAPSASCKDIKFYLVEVSLSDLKAKEAVYLENAPTALELNPEVVDRLKNEAGRLLQRSESFQRLLREL